jgi:hypothetical protein
MLTLARGQSAWFKLTVCSMLFAGVGMVGFVALQDKGDVEVERAADGEAIVPEAVVSLNTPSTVETVTAPVRNTTLDQFSNQEGYRLQRPRQYSDARSWFAYVGAFSSRDRAITHANRIARDFPNVDALVFLDGARRSWVVTLASWTSRERAERAAQFGRDAGIEASSYAEKFPKYLYDANPTLYYFSSLDR